MYTKIQTHELINMIIFIVKIISCKYFLGFSSLKNIHVAKYLEKRILPRIINYTSLFLFTKQLDIMYLFFPNYNSISWGLRASREYRVLCIAGANPIWVPCIPYGPQ